MTEKENPVWEGLKEYNLNSAEDVFNVTETGIRGKVTLLQKLKPNEYLVVTTCSANKTNTSFFQNYIENLKKLGLDVGKGEAKYGYKMPLPNKEDTDRKLIIFRRK